MIGHRRLLLFAPAAIAFFYLDSSFSVLPLSYAVAMFGIFLLLFSPVYFVRKLVLADCVALILVFLTASISSYASGIPSAFMYSLPLVVLLLANFVESRYKQFRSNDVFVIITISILLATPLVVVFASLPIGPGRFSFSWVGNPNYTSMLVLGSFLSVSVLTSRQRGLFYTLTGIISLLIALCYLVLSGSRGYGLSLFLFMISSLLIKAQFFNTIRVLAISVIALSVVVQYFFFSTFSFFASEVLDSALFFDRSNFNRFNAFGNALSYVLNEARFLYTGIGGSQNFKLQGIGEIDLIPHNWFLMMWISNGLMFSLMFMYGLFRFAKTAPVIYLPHFLSLCVFATTLGRAVFFAPLLLFLFSAYIDARRER